ncbi:ABC transporter family substrate-binding protein [Streptomyces sp. NPDC059169]|uniref:ABC transporter family substrate-binding protein n=1 Tax=Streptomyces sp. NPDC059169 TaxID=3346754 RepID=UPI0036C00373
MSSVGAPGGRACSRTPRTRTSRSRTPRTRALRSLAFLTSGALAFPLLAGCSTDDEDAAAAQAPIDIAPAARDQIEQGGTLRWAVDAVPATLNAFQADADDATVRVAGAALPSLYTLDQHGRPQRNADYLESAKVVEREPRQVVLYKLNQQAVWNNGREIGAPDFVAQWRALSGQDSAYWTARNAGYDRIEKIERGASDLEVRVTFAKPYADWQSLFTPLYPKEVMGTPASFNDGARSKLPLSAGPFQLQSVDTKGGAVTLVRNPRWWGAPAKVDALVLRAVPFGRRAAALATGAVDLAEIDRGVADRIAVAARNAGAQGGAAAPPPTKSLKTLPPAPGAPADRAGATGLGRERNESALEHLAAEQVALRAFDVRKTLEPAYTQLALNGESGPLADDRVRRAVARALDREKLAETALKPLGLPARPVGSHLALAGQAGYADNSGALGGQDTEEAQALLADAGWTREGAPTRRPDTKAGPEQTPAASSPAASGSPAPGAVVSSPAAAGTGVGSPAVSSPPTAPAPAAGSPSALASAPASAPAAAAPASGSPAVQPPAVQRPAAGHGMYARPGAAAPGVAPDEGSPVAGAYAPRGTLAPGKGEETPVPGPLGKDGKELTLRFVLPAGPGSEQSRLVGDEIVRMLERIGIRTEITKVADDSYFKDHIASGAYDLALFSWPASAFPATDARPIFAKPVPASDGSLLVEQNYTRVGTDRINQLFDQAVSELDEGAARELMKQADARIWAAAASIPLFQRPELVAAKHDLANAGAFGFATPRYQDIGFRKAKAALNGKNHS